MDAGDFDTFRRPLSTSSSTGAAGGGASDDDEYDDAGHDGQDYSGVDWSTDPTQKPPQAYATLIYQTIKHVSVRVQQRSPLQMLESSYDSCYFHHGRFDHLCVCVCVCVRVCVWVWVHERARTRLWQTVKATQRRGTDTTQPDPSIQAGDGKVKGVKVTLSQVYEYILEVCARVHVCAFEVPSA
jgi:hypothetical protein